MEDLVAVAIALVDEHPAVTGVAFAGSRSRGTHHELSDWDFAVTTPDFPRVAGDMPALVAPLEPLSEQWEPMGHFPVYQVLLRGPTKVEYLFLDETQEAMPAPVPGPDTLPAINTHFWDWTWWIATKQAAGRDDLVAEHLPQLHGHLLRPLGIEAVPRDLGESISAFVARRDALEREYGVSVDRALEAEIRRGIERI
jgi:predicted nucleotidyltransferase